MKNRSNFLLQGDVILRAPTYPINNILDMPKDLAAFFNILLKDEFFKRAIYLASPEFYEKVNEWHTGKEFSKKASEKLLNTLFRYWLRMSSRCTPFGNFAGCALGKLENNMKVILNGKNDHFPSSHLDMNYLCELVSYISSLSTIKNQIRYYPNNSLYTLQDKYRYVEYSIIDKNRKYKVSEVNISKYLDKILNYAINGALLDELVELIIEDGISKGDSECFVNQLVENQILVNELTPVITGNNSLSLLIKKLNSLVNTEDIVKRLRFLQKQLKNPVPNVQDYKLIHAVVKTFLKETKDKDLIQTDLFLSTKQADFSKKAIESIVSQIQDFLVLSNPYHLESLEVFKAKFIERFNMQEIPLTYVLDPEAGIGYDVYTNANTDKPPLLENIDVNNQLNPKESVVTWTKFSNYILEKLKESYEKNLGEIVISDDDIEKLSNHDQTKFPDSMYIMGTLLKDRKTSKYQFVYRTCSGPSAANLLGRFCRNNKVLTKRVKHYLLEEEQKQRECIFAEIVHLPQSRIGNVIARPVLRKYEIPYLANSGADKKDQIFVSDLLVSVRNNEIVLRSKRLGKRIIPRMSTAHNYRTNSLPIYKFLCDLQTQNSFSPNIWDWSMASSLSYLPRVKYKNIILSRAQWRINVSDHESLKKNKSIDLLSYFSKLRKELKMPRYVVIPEGDNEQFLDLFDENCLGILVDYLLKNKSVQLLEFLATPDYCFVENQHGERFVSEIIIPIIKGSVENKISDVENLFYPKWVNRHFHIGSEWLYIKIYSGTDTTERILKEIISLLTKELISNRVVSKWFFVRYSDPEHHIRIRFKGEDKFWSRTLEELYKHLNSYVNKGIKIQTDSYEREIERYGTSTMESSETIFYYDSETVLKFLNLLEDDDDEKYRWIFAMRGIDALLDDFCLALEEKCSLLKMIRQSFLLEFNANKYLTRQIDNKYRNEMKFIWDHMNCNNDKLNGFEEPSLILQERSKKLIPVIKAVKDKIRLNKNLDINQYITSILHMFINRLFQSNHRKQELIIYYFMFKYYSSLVAIKKSK